MWAAHHPRRELFLGISTLITIWGNKFFPRFGDWYLGKTGWKSQQYNGAVDPNRPDYLWAPLPGDFGAHGEFDDRAHDKSPEFWASKHRGWLALATLAVAAFLILCPKRLAARGNKDER